MIPQSLKDRLQRSQVIPFVGAGASRAVLRHADGQPLFPSWRELLIRAADRLETEGRAPESQLVRSLLAVTPPDFLEAARRARDGLGALWPRFLEGEIGHPYKEAVPETLGLARAIWEMGNPLVVTTNYDQVLQWACPSEKDLNLWDIQATAEQVRLLQDGRPSRPTIWHLHGRIGNAAEMILTPDGYSRFYQGGSEGRYRAALTTFRTILASRSLLFLGFSFDDAALGVELRGVNDLFEGTAGPHYALVRAADRDRLRALSLPLQLIAFEDFGEPLFAVVRQLGEIAKTEPGPLVALSAPHTSPADPAPAAPYSPDNRPFFIPFRPKGDRVIGRGSALQRVRDQLTTGRRTSIGQTAAFEGLGGLGKTQLAVEYAWTYRDEYANGVIWLTADQDIAAQLTRLAVEATWVAPESEHKVKLDVALHRLRSYSNTLIIFDNVEDSSLIASYLPLPTADPHLLVTSRTEQPGFIPIPLDLLSEDESLALLSSEAARTLVDGQEVEAARAIARELGGLPLALEMAGAYLLHRPVLWQQYLELLKANLRGALPPRLLDSFTRHEADLYATLRVQEPLLKEEPLLGKILDILTWSGSAPMGLSLLASMLQVDETNLLGALALGVQLRLLERTTGAERYGVHRLVRKVLREDRPLALRSAWADEMSQRLGDWFFTRRKDFANLPEMEIEIDHLETWRQQAASLKNSSGSRLTWLLAYPPFHRGQFAEARKWLELAQSSLKKTTDQDHELEAWLFGDLGAVNVAEGLFREGLELSKQALVLRQAILGDEHLDTVHALNSVGSAHFHLGELNQALELQSRALNIRRRVLGDQHASTAESFYNLGVVYSELGSTTKGLEFSLQALEIQRNVLGENHPDVARSLSSLSFSYGGLGEFEKELETSLQALEIMRNTVGEQHPEIGRSLERVGIAYGHNGDFQKALEFSLRALEVQRKALGEAHPRTANSLVRVGGAYGELADWKKALDLFLKALTIQRATLDRQHPDVARSLTEIGVAYGRLGDWRNSLKFGREALELKRISSLAVHRSTIISSLNVAAALMHLDQRSQALTLLAPLIRDPPSDLDLAEGVRQLVHQLRQKPLRPGFRQPPSRGKVHRKKKRH
jgi:tetratricopeptide (TPR) repeat protein